MKFLVVIFCLYSWSSCCWAGWGPKTRTTIEEVSIHAQALKTPGIGTFWGGFRRYLPITHNDGAMISLKSTLFKAGGLKVYFSEKPFKAPLYVFMPGIFGKADGGLTPLMIDHLEDIGGHVLVVPNVLSAPYLEAHPLYAANPVSLETQVMEEALNLASKRLGTKLGQIHVIAESLGTSIASAWASRDRTHQKRLHSLTLLWPQIKLWIAMKNFDKIIEQHKPAAANCWTIKKLWVIAREFVFSTFPEHLDDSEAECISSIVLVDGFRTAVKKSWQAHLKATKTETAAPTSFEELFQRYRSEIWQLIVSQDEQLSLAHWLKQLAADPQFPVRILTSQDDFLNFGLEWQHVLKSASHPNLDLIVMSWGGHSGPIGMAPFKELLRETLTGK